MITDQEFGKRLLALRTIWFAISNMRNREFIGVICGTFEAFYFAVVLLAR